VKSECSYHYHRQRRDLNSFDVSFLKVKVVVAQCHRVGGFGVRIIDSNLYLWQASILKICEKLKVQWTPLSL